MQTAPLRQKAQMIAWPQIEVSVNSHACSICYGLVAFANMCCWLALILHGMLASVCLPRQVGRSRFTRHVGLRRSRFEESTFEASLC